jgi:iron(III) transport system permease protein
LGRNVITGQVALAALAVLALGVPVWTLLRWLWIGGADVWVFDDIVTALGQTIGLATVAAVLTTVLAFPVAWVAVPSKVPTTSPVHFRASSPRSRLSQ